MAEEFALQHAFRQSRTVDGNKGTAFLPALIVYGVRYQFLARAGLSGYMYRIIIRAEFSYLLVDLEHFMIPTYNSCKAIELAGLHLQSNQASDIPK
ncbi:hypothetical protein ES703_27295 [subsurface metagenome]